MFEGTAEFQVFTLYSKRIIKRPSVRKGIIEVNLVELFTIVVMGPGQKFLNRVGSIFCDWVGSGRVSHLWFGLEFGKFPLKTSNFSIFPFG